MPRRNSTDIQAEDAVTASPLRRSSRIVSRRTSASSEPEQPAKITSTRGRRTSTSSEPEQPAKVTRSKQSSLSQEIFAGEIAKKVEEGAGATENSEGHGKKILSRQNSPFISNSSVKERKTATSESDSDLSQKVYTPTRRSTRLRSGTPTKEDPPAEKPKPRGRRPSVTEKVESLQVIDETEEDKLKKKSEENTTDTEKTVNPSKNVLDQIKEVPEIENVTPKKVEKAKEQIASPRRSPRLTNGTAAEDEHKSPSLIKRNLSLNGDAKKLSPTVNAAKIDVKTPKSAEKQKSQDVIVQIKPSDKIPQDILNTSKEAEKEALEKSPKLSFFSRGVLNSSKEPLKETSRKSPKPSNISGDILNSTKESLKETSGKSPKPSIKIIAQDSNSSKKSDTDSEYITPGLDGSFYFNLNLSSQSTDSPKSANKNSQDKKVKELNTSFESDSSNKENEVHAADTQPNSPRFGNIKRLSHLGFCEPMEVDETFVSTKDKSQSNSTAADSESIIDEDVSLKIDTDDEDNNKSTTKQDASQKLETIQEDLLNQSVQEGDKTNSMKDDKNEPETKKSHKDPSATAEEVSDANENDEQGEFSEIIDSSFEDLHINSKSEKASKSNQSSEITTAENNDDKQDDISTNENDTLSRSSTEISETVADKTTKEATETNRRTENKATKDATETIEDKTGKVTGKENEKLDSRLNDSVARKRISLSLYKTSEDDEDEDEKSTIAEENNTSKKMPNNKELKSPKILNDSIKNKSPKVPKKSNSEEDQGLTKTPTNKKIKEKTDSSSKRKKKDHNTPENKDLNSSTTVSNKTSLKKSPKVSQMDDDELNARLEALVKKEMPNFNDSDSDSSSELHYIDDEAEEGEESDPSDGSNDIIDEGESINSTDSEYGSSGSYENDSFVIDDEEVELLPGNDEVEDLLEEKKNKKKSRIIKMSDSEDSENEESTQEEKETSPQAGDQPPAIKIDEVEPAQVSSTPLANKKEDAKRLSPIITIISDDEEEGEIQENSNTNTQTTSTKIEEKEETTEIIENDENSSKRGSSITILENVRVQDIKDVDLSSQISKVVDMFCNELKKRNSNEIKLNVSLDLPVIAPSRDPSINEGKESASQDTSLSIKNENKESFSEDKTSSLKKKKRRSDTTLEEFCTNTPNASKSKSPKLENTPDFNLSAEDEVFITHRKRDEVEVKSSTKKKRKHSKSLSENEGDGVVLSGEHTNSLTTKECEGDVISVHQNRSESGLKSSTKKKKKRTKSQTESAENEGDLENLEVSFDNAECAKVFSSVKQVDSTKKKKKSLDMPQMLEKEQLTEDILPSKSDIVEEADQINETQDVAENVSVSASKKKTRKLNLDKTPLAKVELENEMPASQNDLVEEEAEDINQTQDVAENISVSSSKKKKKKPNLDKAPMAKIKLENKMVASKNDLVDLKQKKKSKKSNNSSTAEWRKEAEDINETQDVAEDVSLYVSKKKKKKNKKQKELREQLPSNDLRNKLVQNKDIILPSKKDELPSTIKVEYFPEKLLAEIIKEEEKKKKNKRMSKVITESALQQSWNEEPVDLKPSASNVSFLSDSPAAVKSKNKKKRTKEIDDEVSEKKKPKTETKYNPKDFKSRMLHDSNRIKRIDTKTMLKKKEKVVC